MSTDIEILARKLDIAEALLRSFDPTHWADWLREDAQRIRGLDFYGIEHLLSVYGGMGSLTDVVLQTNDHRGLLVSQAENERWYILRTEIYSIALKLKSEED
jgi:hypothetical protein